MFEEIKFTKKQCEVLRQMFDNANKAFDENLEKKPNFYKESERNAYVYGYVEAFIEQLGENGYAYLEE